MTERRTLIVTNDFPPRLGGIQSFVHSVAVRQPASSVVVYTSDHAGAKAFDAAQPFPVIRHPTGLLLPTPGARRRVLAAFREHGCGAVWFGAAAPLALLAPDLRRAGAERIVATTHGHEVGWALLPGGRQALRRIGTECDVVTFLTDYTRQRLAGALGPQATLRRLAPGVDAAQFHPGVDGSAVRARHGLGERPVVACVSRLVPRKGQDALIRALPIVQREVPETMLLLVGRPNRARFATSLRRRAHREGVSADVVLTGGVPAGELVEHYAAGDVFAMPCRTRRFGLDVEGLGIVFLEASALARPVVAGESGGAPEAVLPGVTGYVVDGRDPAHVAQCLVRLLRDADERDRMGQAGRRWVEQEWTWDATAARLYDLVQG